MTKCIHCGEELIAVVRCQTCGARAGQVTVGRGEHWALRDPADPNTAEPCGVMVDHLECPTHGEDCVWRHCKLAEKPEPAPNPRREWRKCPHKWALTLYNDAYVYPAACATCPVPALVTLRQVLDVIGVDFIQWLREQCAERQRFVRDEDESLERQVENRGSVSALSYVTTVLEGRYSGHIERVVAEIDAALALVPKKGVDDAD